MWKLKVILQVVSTSNILLCLNLQIAGIHPQNCRALRTESCNDYALSPESLNEAITLDLANGLIPFFLCATVRIVLISKNS